MHATKRPTALMLILALLLTLIPAYAEDAATEPPEVLSDSLSEVVSPTDAPVMDVESSSIPTDVPETTQVPVSSPTEDVSSFKPGLARIRSGAKVYYETSGLWGEHLTLRNAGVVYATEENADGSALRVTFYDGTGVRTGWVASDFVSMMIPQAVASYDQTVFPPEADVRVIHGHKLAAISATDSRPTPTPTIEPTPEPTAEPTEAPTAEPSAEPTEAPTAQPTAEPTEAPTAEPSAEPTDAPTAQPSAEPTDVPTAQPSAEPTDVPTAQPSAEPTDAPTAQPSAEPTDDLLSDELPEETVEPTLSPESTEQPDPTATPELPEELDDLVEYRALGQPTGISATYDHSGRITLSWLPVEDANAYAVLYKAAWESEYRQLGQSTSTSFSTTVPQMGTVYYYRIQALSLNAEGGLINQGAQSMSFPFIAMGSARMHDPRGFYGHVIRVQWDPIPGATHYDVQMSVHNENNYSTVAWNVDGTLFDVTNLSYEGVYDFRVVPKRRLNNGTWLKGIPSATFCVGSPMLQPSFTSYAWTETGNRLTWNAIDGADGYVIYRRGFNEQSYYKIVRLDTPVTTYVDQTAYPGEVYYYFVYSFKLIEPEGWRCFSLKGDIGMGVWLDAASNVQGQSARETSVRISWNPVIGANKYDVHISSVKGETPASDGRLGNTYGYHNSAVLGKTYYYRVRPVREFSNGDVSYGPWSAECEYTHRESVGTYRALLIGNTYVGEANTLPGCDNDVAGMRSLLQQMTKTPYQITTKTNLRADEIISSIESTFGNAGYNDVSLFYYSGHGANSVDADGLPSSYHGALVGTFQTYVSIARLKSALDKIPGKKVIILDSCHSGQFIGKSGDGDVSASAFNSLVISTFANDAQLERETVLRSADTAPIDDELGLLTQELPPMTERDTTDNFAKSGYYVITAARSAEKSVSTGYDSNGDGRVDRYFGLFTYGLCHGSGWNLARNAAMSTMAGDLNGNGEVTLYEAYVYARTIAQQRNPNQTAQIWPSNSALVLWAK